ncbi:hypothetical protein IM543_14185 [Massilia sp. UMI-21]|nr:hypothetical protein IM543_14185 [Massilia sp. UMI-21]
MTIAAGEVEIMNKHCRRACVAALLAALAPGLAPVAAAAPDYFSVSPAGSKYARAGSLNDLGRYAVNSFGPESPYQGASINGGPSSESVPGLGGYSTQVWGLNNRGEAVGLSTTGAGESHVFLYSYGRMQDLSARYGVQWVRDINDRGDIAVWTADFRAGVLRGGVVDDPGLDSSAPVDLNERGALLLDYFPSAGYRSAIYDDGTLTDLPLAGGMRVSGQAINDAGWVTGYFTSAQGRQHAFLWDGQTFTNLTPWARNSFGYDINNLGQVVGVSDERAFLYADGELIDLNTRIDRDADLLLISAEDINDRTQILANSCDRTGVFCYGSMLLTPVPGVPEASPVAMLSIGVALLAWLRTRSSKAGAVIGLPNR